MNKKEKIEKFWDDFNKPMAGPKYKKNDIVEFTVTAKIKMLPIKDLEGIWHYPFKQDVLIAIKENDLELKGGVK